MDIIITGRAGVGKTTAAEQIICAHFGAKNIYGVSVRQLLICHNTCLRVDVTREMVRAARVEAVLFDGGIANDDELCVALQAVKEARQQTGRNLYAVYVIQYGDALNVRKYEDNIDVNSINFSIYEQAK